MLTQTLVLALLYTLPLLATFIAHWSNTYTYQENTTGYDYR